MKRNKVVTAVMLLLIISGSLFYLIEKDVNPLYSESDSDYIKSVYQKVQLDGDITKTRRNIITETVRLVSPAIVGINVISIRQYRDPFSYFFDDPFFRQFFGNRGNYSQKVKGLGSGFIISSDGYIITNDHVAGNATEITVTMTNGKHYSAQIIGTDPVSDICLLKIDAKDLPYIRLGSSDDIMIGEWVIAMGNPFGLFELNNQPTVTVGVVSSTGMNLEPINNRYYLDMIQTDAAINGGNSGGPLINSLGEVIGMNTLIFTAGGRDGSIGLGFAIPINKVKRIVEELREKGKIDRTFSIGMKIQTIDEQIANYYKLKTSRGVIVTQVTPGTPAARAGIRVGDIITKIEDYFINNDQTLIGVFQEFRADQTISLTIVRDDEIIQAKMKLEK
jgi:serine protease Do